VAACRAVYTYLLHKPCQAGMISRQTAKTQINLFHTRTSPLSSRSKQRGGVTISAKGKHVRGQRNFRTIFIGRISYSLFSGEAGSRLSSCLPGMFSSRSNWRSRWVKDAMSNFMFATGIENSYPTILLPDGTVERVDEMEKCGHYARWRDDFRLVQELGIRYLRYGPPLYSTHVGPGRYDWALVVVYFRLLC